MALFHSQFERVHPFQDGNGRIGRELARAQALAMVGREPAKEDRAAYHGALAKAQTTGDLRDLARTLTGVRLPEGLVRSEYPAELWPAPLEKRGEDGRIYRVMCKDSRVATLVEALPVELTKRLRGLSRMLGGLREDAPRRRLLEPEPER